LERFCQPWDSADDQYGNLLVVSCACTASSALLTAFYLAVAILPWTALFIVTVR
jgi:hypothetical protein